MSEKIIKCSNCGAQIDVNVSKCPYCGYINETGAEKQYMGELKKVREDMDVLDEEASAEYKRSLSKGVKIAIIVAAVVVLISLIIWGVSCLINKSIEQNDTAEMMEELRVSRELIPKIEEKYVAGDFAEAYKLMCSTDVYIGSYGYEHYSTIDAYAHYRYISDIYLPIYKEGRCGKREFTELFLNCSYYYYRCYENTLNPDSEYYDRDLAFFESLRDECVNDILFDHMGYTDEEMQSYAAELNAGRYIERKNGTKISKKNYSRYKSVY
ncbi:MAG: zinc ribbon domain-containing protein [Lachnospiraceae bacterium]|nr:zinc ribbon domain-containing protein [Candidatus Colinaster equi]